MEVALLWPYFSPLLALLTAGSVKPPFACLDFLGCAYKHRYFQHAHFIPIVGAGKRVAYSLIRGVLPRQHPFGTTLGFFWTCASGLSAANAIITQLRDPMKTGLTRWRVAV